MIYWQLISQMGDCDAVTDTQPELHGWQRLVGTWATEPNHPAFHGTGVSGQATFECLEDQRFLIQRSHYDHPEIRDAIVVTGIIDGKPSRHYFDPIGMHRVFAVDITADTWRFWNDAHRDTFPSSASCSSTRTRRSVPAGALPKCHRRTGRQWNSQDLWIGCQALLRPPCR
jgi:hypothetical protein